MKVVSSIVPSLWRLSGPLRNTDVSFSTEKLRKTFLQDAFAGSLVSWDTVTHSGLKETWLSVPVTHAIVIFPT